MVGRAERQSVAPRVLRTAGVPGSRKRKPRHSITIVASISRVGMIRQHAHGKVSRANNFWERPMHFEKQLSDALSPLLFTGQGDVGQGDSGNPSGIKPVLRSPSRRSESTVTVPVAVERAARSEAPGVASPGCSASLTSLAGKLWSRARAKRDRRLAIAELRSLDDRALRDIGICRFDIECFARHG